MKVGIDGYSFHRYFGQSYPGLEQTPGEQWTVIDFLTRGIRLGADGLAIESFMIPSGEVEALSTADSIRETIDSANMSLAWAWGHPNGLGSGTTPEALGDLENHVRYAARADAGIMRICAGGRSTRIEPWAEHRRLLLPLLERAARFASGHGITLALENHADLTVDEILDLVTTIDHPALTVCLDTGNNLRMLEDPEEVVRRLAPLASIVHLKDLMPHRGDPRSFSFWPSVPTGRGIINIAETLRELNDNDFDGLLAVEIDYLHPELHMGEEDALAESLAFTRRTIAELASGHRTQNSAPSPDTFVLR